MLVTDIIFIRNHNEKSQKKIVLNAKRIAKNEVLIMDISPNYKPSSLMLSGEPYLINYKRNIMKSFLFENLFGG